MSPENKILILDSCILFDLLDLNLMEVFFHLEFRVFTTQQVIAEIKNESQLSQVTIYISSGSLTEDSNGSFETIQSLFEEHPGLSFTDSSVLELAIRKNGIILSSDKSLRNVSKSRNLNAKGVLWIIETLLDKNIISHNTALKTLRIYPNVNLRAPIDEITILISKLENKQ